MPSTPFHLLPLSEQVEIYLASMSPKEKKGFDIAKQHLGSSFQIEKSIGFIKFSIQKKETEGEERP